jgi:hypothetical protein
MASPSLWRHQAGLLSRVLTVMLMTASDPSGPNAADNILPQPISPTTRARIGPIQSPQGDFGPFRSASRNSSERFQTISSGVQGGRCRTEPFHVPRFTGVARLVLILTGNAPNTGIIPGNASGPGQVLVNGNKTGVYAAQDG